MGQRLEQTFHKRRYQMANANEYIILESFQPHLNQENANLNHKEKIAYLFKMKISDNT